MSAQGSSDDISDGDLGLGDGLKPGGIPNMDDLLQESEKPSCSTKTNDSTKDTNGYQVTASDISSNSGFTTPADSDDEFEISLMPISSIQNLKSQYSYLNNQSKRCQEILPPLLKEEDHIYDQRYFDGSGQSDCKEKPQETNGAVQEKSANFPVYADVPYGTSIRQQKELFQHSIEGLRKKMKDTLSGQNGKSSKKESSLSRNYKDPSKKLSSEQIAMSLAETLQEVDDLKAELETCEQRLESKYKAIDILRKQAEEAQLQLRSNEKLTKETTMKLAQVRVGDTAGGGNAVVSLEAEQDLADLSPHVLSSRLSARSGPDKPSSVPLEKYSRLCRENKSLMDELEVRTEELRKMSAQKMAVDRENDELLALLDIQERAKYEKTRSISSEENYCTFTTTELSVLGACRCRISQPDPCGCALAAASLKRDIVKLKEQILQYKNRRDEAFLTVDAYRRAFEEQLQRNKSLTVQLSNLSCSGSTSRSNKARSALRWLIGTLSDEDLVDEPDTVSLAGPAMSDQEVIACLTEMICEKKEVLAHQKLAAQILGDRVKVLEEKLGQYEKEEGEVFRS